MLKERTYLILDKKLDTLDGSSGGLGDGSGNTTHCYERLADGLGKKSASSRSL
jgi:hypothetical protein